MILAFTLGAAGRWLRRLRRLPPRVWYGPAPLHMTRYTAAATRLAGFPSRTVVTHVRLIQYDLVTGRDFDRVIGEPEVRWDDRHWVALTDLLLRGDLWIAYFDSHFFPMSQALANGLAFLLLRLGGVRIVVLTHASDIIQWSPQKTRFDWIERMQRDYPAWDFTEQTIMSKQRIALFNRSADLVIAPYYALRRLLPRHDVVVTPFSIDCAEIAAAPWPSNRIPVIIHAPNHRNVKGTAELTEAVRRLNERGIACELRLIEGVARDEALRMYGEADIIADQLIIGAFGLFAPEGMALGRPVLTYLDQEMLGDPVFNFPLVNANPDNVEGVLAALVQVPELRRRLGQASRASVERYLSPEAMAEVWSVIVRHVWWGEPLRLEGTRHFSRERTPRAFTEDPADPAFWPVDVRDLMDEIQRSVTLSPSRP